MRQDPGCEGVGVCVMETPQGEEWIQVSCCKPRRGKHCRLVLVGWWGDGGPSTSDGECPLWECLPPMEGWRRSGNGSSEPEAVYPRSFMSRGVT